MRTSWNKGYTKETNLSVLNISRTMKSNKLDNFINWREKMKSKGLIFSKYPPLLKGGDLAELIGVILGDGHIEKFPRTECLYILSNIKNLEFVYRYSQFVHKLFGKKPTCSKVSTARCIRIRLYQKDISRRLSIPFGARLNKTFLVPKWILKNKAFMIRYLRGLYEAEGSVSSHEATCTYKLFFTNRNKSLRTIVFNLLKKLGFHPHVSGDDVQLSRKTEVEECVRLIQFRKY
jgi:hypothetical protein